jgi:protein phosphatase
VGGRERQEDANRSGRAGKGWYLIVCDGLGGRPDGDRCAQLAAEAAEDYLLRLLRGPDRKKLASRLMEIPEQVQVSLQRAAMSDELDFEAASTLSVAYVDQEQAWLVSVGDSRCSVVREGSILETTTPHNLLAQAIRDNSPLLDEGLQEEHLAASITRSISPTRGGDFDSRQRAALLIVPVQAGDTIVVTSDGVHEALGLDELTTVLDGADDPGVAQRLVDSAVAGAGARADNATAVVLRLRAEEVDA